MFVNELLQGHMLSFLLATHVAMIRLFEDPPACFPKWWYHIALPQQCTRVPAPPISSTCYCPSVEFEPVQWCDLVFHCGSDLHLMPSDVACLRHVYWDLYMFCGVNVKILCCFFFFLLWRFCLIVCTFWNRECCQKEVLYFLPFSGLTLSFFLPVF